ncbi:adenylate kinase [Aeromonas media]|uniref:adenylate kinase n=1 Tax=Aeromonas TaxID=642 RepID=UPI000F7AEE90|nr:MULTISPECIES: adenylate kinase [Aeromonas]QJT27202.1 adenylate kinase [Aeromonas media]RSM23231.1 adenylate kinase [Aeromonas salmonicida]
MKVALMGVSGSGKDYLAKHLISEHGFIRFSFSDQLKKLAHYIYPWLDIDYQPETKTLPLNITLSTGEKILSSPRDIWLSLNSLRHIEEQIFIRMLSEEINTLNHACEKNIIITDIRSTNELLWCKKNNFAIIYIEREGNDYEKYEIDKYVIENKSKSDYTFNNASCGTGAFDMFFQEVFVSGQQK